MCDGSNSAADISRKLSRELNREFNEDLVWLAIDQLKKEDLLENGQEIRTRFEGASRRELIRRVGLASMMALPAISSLLAPTAAMAQSVCSNPGGAAPDTLVGACSAAVGQPPATLQLCTTTCQNSFGASCSSCNTYATPLAGVPGTFACRCA